MISSPWPLSRLCAVVLLLALCCLTAPPSAMAATVDSGAPTASAVVLASVPVVGWVNEVMGNRTRMIQIACVVGVIGIFFLTRHYRN
jgi:hypothetical protein